ncbi:MAG: competence/damage-inducible protein A [Isosphaeraceae bacterium]
MKAEIIAIGSELVSGQSLDTNSQWLSKALGAVGIPTRFHTTLGDDLAENVQAFQFATRRAGLVLVTGGLGPTQDDLTREVLAQVAGVLLVEDPESLEALIAFFARRDRPMPDRNRVQAILPEGAIALPNRVGTAPGIWTSVGNSTVVCLPGVPHEMMVMFNEQVIPRLKANGWGGRLIVERKINLFGRGESEVETAAPDLTARGRIPEVGITAHEATISFRVSGVGTTPEEAEAQMAPTIATIYERFADLILGEGSDDLPEAVFAQLRRTGATLATAESCTGGLVASLLTRLPGVSAHYLGGVVSYANAAKVELLGVDRALLDRHGAVSEEVASAMALGIRGRLGADLAVSVTGIAGPGGGSSEKPVGLVYLGLATAEGVATRRLEIGPEQPRLVIQGRSAKHALNWVRQTLRARESATP